MDEINLKPGVLTKIENQKKRKNRVSLFIDDEFRFGIDKDIFMQQQLSVGSYLTTDVILFILEEEEYRKALVRAYEMLARRARSIAEVQKKFKELGFHQLVSDKVIARLIAEKYLDDHAFALAFSRSRLRVKPMGKMLLFKELRMRSIDREIAEKVIDEIYSATEESTWAKNALVKKDKNFTNLAPELARKKRIQFLKSRGFSWDTIREALDQQ
ncbi:MAG: hypothetical protein DWQ05_03360 [Calditrichaeota bacterium]|nr:MAG: hypothetical protein DWQ05_03360 [Calditrichota bacterium]